MKRTITLIFAIVLALVMVMSLAACGGTAENSLNSTLVGKWKSEDGKKIEFFKDGSCLFPHTGVSTTNTDYQLFTVYENHSIVFAYYGAGTGGIDYLTYTYEISDDSLTIEGVKYIKQ